MGRLALALALSPLFLATASFAATSGPFSTTFTNTALPISGATSTLPKFDPSLGTLTDVQISLVGTANGGFINWTNASLDSTAQVKLTIGAQVIASSPDLVALVTLPQSANPAYPFFDSVAPTATLTVTGAPATDSNNADLGADSNYIAGFVGDTFTVTLNASNNAATIVGSGSGSGTNSAGVGGGTVSVTYTYSTVPEPASIGLLAIGALAAVARRRRA